MAKDAYKRVLNVVTKFQSTTSDKKLTERNIKMM